MNKVTQEKEAVIVCPKKEHKSITVPKHEPIKKVYVEMVRNIVEEIEEK